MSKFFIALGIALGTLVGLVLIVNLLIATVFSKEASKIIKAELQKNLKELPFDFTDVSINPLLGEITLSGFSLPAGAAGTVALECKKATLHLNPAEIIAFLAGPETASLKSASIRVEQVQLVQVAAGMNLSCRSVDLKFAGNVSKSLLEAVSKGDIGALFTGGQKLHLAVRDLAVDPTVADFDVQIADLDLVTDKQSHMQIKSSKLQATGWNGDIEAGIALNMNDPMLSRFTDGKITLNVQDESLKELLKGLFTAEGDTYTMNLKGTVGQLLAAKQPR